METKQHKNNIVALYARVSTAGQEQEQTIDSQIAEIRAQVTLDGNILPDEHIYADDGWSGELLQRPALDEMMLDAKEQKFGKLYVYDRGRLSRIFTYQEIIIDELTNQGIEFVSLHDVQELLLNKE